VSSNSIRLDSNSGQFSESATKALSMQWSIYSHRLTYQWTWFYVHMQIVSLLQWQVESWSFRWASRLVSLLQWHSSSMQWSTYSHRSIYQWIDLPRVHVQLVSLLQWSFFSSHSESATIDISMIWKINRKIGRKASVELYVSAMNYITSHRDMTFKEKRVMLRSVSTLNRV